MMLARSKLASSMLARACSFVKRASLHHLQHIKTLYTATILQSALYGVEIWGLTTLPSMVTSHPFNNPTQNMLHSLIKSAWSLKKTTPHIVLALESGIKPACSYACKRVAKFLDACESSTIPVLPFFATSPAIIAPWKRFLHATLNLPPPIFSVTSHRTSSSSATRSFDTLHPRQPSSRAPLPRLCRTVTSYMPSRSSQPSQPPLLPPLLHPPSPPDSSSSSRVSTPPNNLALLPALQELYSRYLHQYTVTDTQHPDCHFRRTSTYIQHVWHGVIGKPHPAYGVCITAPRLHYTSWCRMRVLNISLSVYAWHQTPFSLRRCPHCPHAISDLFHHVTACPHSLAAVQGVYPNYQHPTSISELFDKQTDPFLCMKYVTILCAHAARHYSLELVPYVA